MEETAKLLNKKETASFLRVSARTVENLMRRGLPYIKLSARATRFRMSDLQGWLTTRCKV